MLFKTNALLLLSLLTFNSFALFAKEPKLIFALDVVRHGDRTAIHDIPSLPYKWKEGRGQLTAKGMQQHFELGSKLRKRYIEELKLLGEVYHPKSVYVRSTDTDRTLMSAQSLLYGLYPLGSGPKVKNQAIEALPGAFQPIPIHTQALSDKDVLLVDTHQSKFQEQLHKHVKTHSAWIAKNNALKHNYPRWSKATGLVINDLYQLISLGNTIFVYQSNHVPVPSTLTSKDIEQIKDAGKWAF